MKTPLRFCFFGTPELSAEILEHLKRHELVPSLIVTNPDRPQGRNLKLTPSPVKLWALSRKIALLQPESLSDPDFLERLHAVRCTLFIVVAYGKILPKALLDIPPKGCLNIHYSLLPKYRGASPIETQILNDDHQTGVSILLLDEQMDHGPIVAQSNFPPTTNNRQLNWPPKASELRSAYNQLAGELLIETIPLWCEEKITAREQDHTKATYTKKFTKADGEIDLADDPYKDFLKIQAFDDSIGTYFFVQTPVKKIRVVVKSAEYRDGKLLIIRVLPEGKKEMGYDEFLRGLK